MIKILFVKEHCTRILRGCNSHAVVTNCNCCSKRWNPIVFWHTCPKYCSSSRGGLKAIWHCLSTFRDWKRFTLLLFIHIKKTVFQIILCLAYQPYRGPLSFTEYIHYASETDCTFFDLFHIGINFRKLHCWSCWYNGWLKQYGLLCRSF